MRRKSTSWESPSHWVQCAHGHDHWGRDGAAGMLLRHTDDSGLERYFLQQRGPYVQAPGTWSSPGGAIEPSESPHAAAMREAQEALGSFPAYNLQHLHTSDCGGWNYHLMRADVPQPFYPATAGWDNDETGDVGWFTPQEIDELPLHPGFRATWEQIKPNQKPDPHREIWSKMGSHKRAFNPSFYHVAPAVERARIQTHGLYPSDPKQTWDITHPEAPTGLYAFPTLDEAQEYSDELTRKRDQTHDIWEIPNAGPWRPDPENAAAFTRSYYYQGEPIMNPRLVQREEDYDFHWMPKTRSPDYETQRDLGYDFDPATYRGQLRNGNPWGVGRPDRVIGSHQHALADAKTDLLEGDRVITPEGPGEVWEINPSESRVLPVHINLDEGYDDWYHPDEIQRVGATWSVPLEEQDGSTVPTEVANPEDHWPEHGERPPDRPKHVDTDYEWAYTRV